LNDRIIDQPNTVNMTLDVTECPIQRPSDNIIQRQYYSGKKRKHTIKYELGVQLQTGAIVWLAGGVPGSVHDLNILRSCNLLSKLLIGEFILADRAYIGENYILHPFKSAKSMNERNINTAISNIRETVEHTIHRIKIFGFTQQKWRHSINLHPIAFKVICHTLNIEFIFKPVHQ
jgi:hypothetical protein